MSVKIKAKQFIKKIGGELNFLSIKQYYEKNGWKIMSFNESSQIIVDLDLVEEAKTEKGFIFSDDRLKYIFINSNLTPCEKRDVIFHEAGHIELNHEFSDLKDEAIEREANEFTNILIKHFNESKKCNTQLITIYCLIVALILSGLFTFFKHNNSNIVNHSQSSYNSEIITSNSNDVVDEFADFKFVYVTPYGKKYHLENCRYVRDKQNKQKLDFETAKMNYLPCSICIK